MNFNPDSWIDIVAYLIVGIPAIIAAVGVMSARRTQQDNHEDHEESVAAAAKTASAVLEEVRNDHSTNLRDDIDALASQIKQGFKEIHIDISGLREELRTERIERIEGDRRHP